MLTERDRKIEEGLMRRKQILDAMKHWQQEYHESCAIAYGAINDGFYLLSIIKNLRQEQKESASYAEQQVTKLSEALAESKIQSIQQRGKHNQLVIDNERMKDAIGAAHQSLTWSNTENQIPHAVWHLEQVLNLLKAPETTE
jgi:hypothetical protein